LLQLVISDEQILEFNSSFLLDNSQIIIPVNTQFKTAFLNDNSLNSVGHSSGVPRNFFSEGGKQIQLKTEDGENGDLGAVAP